MTGASRGRGRGRGRPPLNPTAKVGSPTESAQILLSLSGGSMPTSSGSLFQGTSNLKQPVKIEHNSTALIGAPASESKVSLKYTQTCMCRGISGVEICLGIT